MSSPRHHAEPLPVLLDCRAIMRETGVSRSAAEAIMRALPLVTIPDLRKVYVRRDDVLALIDEPRP
jgi:hypothetical protein